MTRDDVLIHIKTLHGHQRRDQLVALRSLFTWAKRQGLIFRNPTSRIKVGQNEYAVLQPLLPEQVERSVTAAMTPAARLVLALAAVHAARVALPHLAPPDRVPPAHDGWGESNRRFYDMPVTETLPPVGIDLYDVARLQFTEVEEPPLSAQNRAARDRMWDKAVQANPALFDGPVVACAELERVGPGILRLSWARVTYRHYALRRVPGATALPSLFVNVVQPTDDGRVLAARMSPSTAAPGRWQLPGGSVEPPQDGEVLDEPGLAGQAARELVEELGIGAAPETLRLWAVTRGENRSVGLTYLAPALPEASVRTAFAAAAAAERAQGREPELDDIALVRSLDELVGLTGPHADYLGPVIRRYSVGR
ncbi:NUDIX domain-containing protein [Streptomyces huasconensis]|uniref:NUDIX domain-containing protein n=1 Tax=Streptomyces huasconensis TaxID=1854574 RepID=A0ABV3M4L7_9ACTN